MYIVHRLSKKNYGKNNTGMSPIANPTITTPIMSSASTTNFIHTGLIFLLDLTAGTVWNITTVNANSMIAIRNMRYHAGTTITSDIPDHHTSSYSVFLLIRI